MTSHRCDKAGFVCKGYAVPKPWIFEPRTSQNHESSPPHYRRDIAPSADSTTFTPIAQIQEYFPVLSKVLTLGNSDPFHAFAIQIGPTDNFYLKYYHLTVIPQLYTIQNRRWTSSLASNERNACLNSLGDEAAAYSLLARNAAIHSIQSGPERTTSLTTVFKYQARAHAALRKKLTSLDETATNNDAVIYETMRATYLLAITDLLLKTSSAKVHLSALCELFTRYVSVKRARIDQPKFLFPFYVDIQYACTTLSRPMLDILKWFPAIESFSYSKWHVPDKSFSHDIHPDIEDEKVRRMIILKREGQYVHRDLNDHQFDADDLKYVSFAIHSRNIWFQGVILNVALDALDELQTLKVLGVTDYVSNTRAFIAVAVLHWGRFASQFHVAGKLLYDDAPLSIPLLRLLLLQHESSNNLIDNKLNRKSYLHARFWALFVGAQAEQNREGFLGLGKLCGDWFLNAFRAQARAMGVSSWEEAVPIFRQFLYNDHLKPHISTWWQ